MRKALVVASCAIPAALLLTFPGESVSLGLFPGDSIVIGLPPNQTTVKVGALTRDASKSCGQCHSSSISPFRKVTVDVADRIVEAGKSTAVTISGSNTGISGTRGGFVADVTNGTLVAGTNSRVNTGATAITHKDALSRSWKFSFKAPTTPGLSELYTVVNVVDGNGQSSGKDEWNFHSGLVAPTKSTPVRILANAPGNSDHGVSCPDGYGNISVLGSTTTPKIGQNYSLVAYGLPPSALTLLMLSVSSTAPPVTDMTVMGTPGCFLRTAIQLEAFLVTTGGDASRAEGTVNITTKLPSDNNLVGQTFHVQLMTRDKKSTKPLNVVTTNRHTFTIQK
jgi:hypothetical protein